MTDAQYKTILEKFEDLESKVGNAEHEIEQLNTKLEELTELLKKVLKGRTGGY